MNSYTQWAIAFTTTRSGHPAGRKAHVFIRRNHPVNPHTSEGEPGTVSVQNCVQCGAHTILGERGLAGRRLAIRMDGFDCAGEPAGDRVRDIEPGRVNLRRLARCPAARGW